MAHYLEARTPTGVALFTLESERVTIGRSPDADVSLEGDAKVSWLHAQLEMVGEDWCVSDLSSTNGTFVNGTRILGSQPVYGGDEVLVGSTQLLLRAPGRRESSTERYEPPPQLTPREHDVLVALFPAAQGEFFTEPASTKEIAAALFVSEAAVKQHLLHLYDKFGITEGDRRRVRLANEALRRRAITPADIRQSR